MIRVLVADDHALVRRGLAQVLAEARGFEIGGEAASAQEVLERLAQSPCDCLILDIKLPGTTGLELLAEVKRRWPRLPVVILTVYSEEQFAVRALRAGAAGYLTKESAPERLVEAVRKVVRGGRWVSPELAERLALSLDAAHAGAPHEALSEREYQVLRLLASGRTVGGIATELNLSVKTISTYRARVLEKMGMSNNAELTHYAVRSGLVD